MKALGYLVIIYFFLNSVVDLVSTRDLIGSAMFAMNLAIAAGAVLLMRHCSSNHLNDEV